MIDGPAAVARPLARLAVGETGRVVRIDTSEPQRLVRLSALGIVPGARITLRQKRPATILRVAQTTVALDPDVAGEIWVEQSA